MQPSMDATLRKPECGRHVYLPNCDVAIVRGSRLSSCRCGIRDAICGMGHEQLNSSFKATLPSFQNVRGEIIPTGLDLESDYIIPPFLT